MAGPVSASTTSDTGWFIASFDADISILEDGSVRVEETIAADFQNLQKHGIFRDIPYIYTAKDGSKVYTSVEDVAVAMDGSAVRSVVSNTGNYVQVKIGDPDLLISGIHTYTISYTARGVLKGFADYDELYWNVTGDMWPVPILNANATVRLPKTGVKQVACYQGVYGANGRCTSSNIDPEAFFTSTRELQPGEGLTIAVGYSKGMVPLLTVQNPLIFNLIAGVLIAIGTLLLGLLIRKKLITRHSLVRYRDRNKVLVAEYEAPDKLRPGQVGVLLDTRADTLDVSATIVDLAVRGYLTITELSSTGKKKDYQLTKLEKDTSILLPYEQLVLQELFTASPTVALSSLANTFYTSVAKVSTALGTDLKARGYFSSHPGTGRTVFTQAFILVGFLISLPIFAGVFWPPLFGVALGCFVLIIIFVIDYATLAPVTASGKEVYRGVLGFKVFLSATEKYRQPFFENQNYFMDVLPYAMVFGVTDKLAKAFERMGYVPTKPDWYIASSFVGFNSFSNQITDMSKQLNTSFSPPASSGSGSGGGGFSGGGGGGGGGGSW